MRSSTATATRPRPSRPTGSIYKRGKKLWLRFKGPDGKWTQSPSGFEVGQEQQAREALRRLEDRLAANVEFGEPEKGPVTLARYTQRWLEQRKGLVADLRTDESRLRLHVLPYIGEMALEDIRPRHLVDLFRQLRVQGAIAPKTVHNIYGVLKALFRDAHLADLVATSPCILTRHQLGENVDKDPTWRATAAFTHDELEMLISDSRVPPDRQVLYALQGIAALRHGEAAGLRWKHYEPNTPMLGRLVIATSYDKGHTKTKRTRYMPVHPTLAALLAEWKLRGWPEMMGRSPTPEDLGVPMPRPTNRGPRVEFGGMRTDHHSYKWLVKDMEALGLGHRRGHDLRRTMISLARTDGARKDILELCTHTPRKSGNTIDLYTTFSWEALCAEVAKLKVQRHERGQLARLALAASADKETPARLMATGALLHPLLQSPGKLSPFREIQSGGGGIRSRQGRSPPTRDQRPLPHFPSENRASICPGESRRVRSVWSFFGPLGPLAGREWRALQPRINFLASIPGPTTARSGSVWARRRAGHAVAGAQCHRHLRLLLRLQTLPACRAEMAKCPL